MTKKSTIFTPVQYMEVRRLFELRRTYYVPQKKLTKRQARSFAYGLGTLNPPIMKKETSTLRGNKVGIFKLSSI